MGSLISSVNTREKRLMMQKSSLVKILVMVMTMLNLSACANKVYSFTDSDDALAISDRNVTMSKALYLKITDSLSECLENNR